MADNEDRNDEDADGDDFREKLNDKISDDTIDEIENEAGQSAGASTETRAEKNGEEEPMTILMQNLADLSDLVTSYLEEQRENRKVENKREQEHLAHQRRVVYVVAGTFLVVIGIAAVMTYADALSGDAFTFVLGSLFGAILTFLQENLMSRGPAPEE